MINKPHFLFRIAIAISLSSFITGCSKTHAVYNRGTTYDTSNILHIALVDRMPDVPVNYKLIDWNKRARDFDAFIYDASKTGQYLPIITPDYSNSTFKIPAYVGINLPDGGEEAVATLQSVLGATLAGIDKSNQNGTDYVTQIQVYKNRENVITNNPKQLSGN